MNNQKRIRVRIAATGDVHGAYTEGGLASAATWIATQRNTLGRNFIYLDAGDLLQGGTAAYYANFILPHSAPLAAVAPSSAYFSHPAAEMLNYLGCSAATIGNHDIEMGEQAWGSFACTCKAPLLAANMEGPPDSPLRPYTIVECGPAEDPIRIAIIGMITEALSYWVPKNNWKGYKCRPILSCLGRWIEEIKAKEHPHAIVGLFHSGLKGGIIEKKESILENCTLRAAKEIPGLDLIIYGHDHRLNCQHLTGANGRDLLLLNPGSHGSMLVYADLDFEQPQHLGSPQISDGHTCPGSPKYHGTPQCSGGLQRSGSQKYTGSLQCSGSCWRISSGTARSLSLEGLEPDKEFLERFGWLRTQGESYANRPIATLTKELHLKEIFHGPCEFMDLLHQAQLKATGAQISFASPLFIEEVLHKGVLRQRHLYKLYRFENMLCTMAVSGREIKNLLEYSYSEWICTMRTIEDPMFLLGKPLSADTPAWFKNIVWDFDTACGIDYDIDLRQPYGKRITIHGLYNPLQESAPLSWNAPLPASAPLLANTPHQVSAPLPASTPHQQVAELEPFLPDKQYTVVVNSYRACGGGLLWTRGAGIPHRELPKRIISTTREDIRTILAKHLAQQPLTPQLISRWRFLPKEWAEYHKSDLKW